VAADPVEKIVERAYFHVGNGGLTLSIVEVKPAGDGAPAEWRFKHELALFGQKAESSFPLGSSEIVSWMNMALQRVSMRVAAAMSERSFQPFESPDITHTNGEEVSKLASLFRIVARYQRRSFEFPSPEALHKYLYEHPGADKSLHKVKEHDEHEHGHGGEHGEKKPEKKSWSERLKTLGQAAKKFISAAPKSVQQFISDDKYRKQVIANATEALRTAPEKMIHRVVDSAKEEVHEFKEAGAAIKKIFKGEQLSKEDHAVISKVAMHMAIGLAAATLSGGGAPLAASAAFGKALARKIALKAVRKSLEHVHTMGEVGEIGHGLTELMEVFASTPVPTNGEVMHSEKEPDPHEALARLVAAAVAKELQDIDPDTMAEALEEATKDEED
jgi:hypothetical protein